MKPIYFLALGLMLWSCSTETELPVSSLVKPPIPGAEPGFVEFEVDAATGGKYVHASGTTVTIPPHAFADADGQPLTGRVKLQYREMHDAAAVYLAGIPMDYSGGHFTTAGSFELRADAGVSFLPGKSACVEMASYEAADDYDFFYLEEYGEGWEKLGTQSPEINQAKKELLEKINRMKPGVAFPLSRQYMAFNYYAILDVYYNNDWSKADDAKVHQDMEAYGLSWTKAEVHQHIEFKGAWEHASLMVWKKISKPEFPDWTAGRYGILTPVSKDVYDYKVFMIDQNKDTLHFEARLQAVMPLKTLFAFPPEKWANDYQAVIAKIEEERKRAEIMADVFRSFEISQLGIYNWDKLLLEEDRIIVKGQFEFPVEVNERLSDIEVVYLTGDKKGLIKFPSYAWDQMAIQDDPNASLFAIMPGNTLALYAPSQYREIDFETLRKQEKPGYTFAMKGNQTPVRSEADFRQMLGI